MKIDSMDASAIVMPRAQEPKPVTNDNDSKSVNTPVVESRIPSHMTEYEKRELPISEKVVIDAIEKANRAISISNRKFEYAIHEKTKEIMIKVIDSDTNEVVREIPPEKVLDMVAKMWEMAGIIVDERR